MNTYLHDVGKVLKLAESLGATEAEVYRVWSREAMIKATDKIVQPEVLELDAIGVRVAVGKRVAVVGTQDLSEAGIRKAVEAAVSIAKAANEDPDWRGFNDEVGLTPLNNLWDRETAGVSPEDLASVVKDAITAVSEGSPASKPVRCLVSASSLTIEFMNSYGGPVKQRMTSVGGWIYVKAVKDGKEGTFSGDAFARNLREFKLSDAAREAGAKAPEFIDSKPIPTGTYDVILAPCVTTSVLAIMLMPALSALSVQQGRSPLAGKVGEAVMAKHVTIIDAGADPTKPDGREFDDEGHPTVSRALVKEGILLDYAYDSYTAKKEGRRSTGNAWRKYSSTPSPRPNHILLKAGDASLDEMVREVKNGLLVESTIGEWLSNPVSGNLNATVTHAYLIRGGEIKGTVKGVVLSGNFYELMKSNIDLIGRKVETHGSATAPHILLRNLKIAGK